MIRFAHQEYLMLLLVIPVLLLGYAWSRRMRSSSLRRFGNPEIVNGLIPSFGKYKAFVKMLFLSFAMLFVILGLANPQIGTKMEEVKREGVDIMIALDVSNSMKAEDLKPNRLENAKQEIARMIEKLQNDRIGIIVFGGDSYLQLPLTTDYSAARLILGTIDTDIMPIPGTAIGSAIKLSMKSFQEGEKKHKVIVLITDGENHEDDAVAVAGDAAKEGVVIHTIGMGSPEGSPIPVYQNNVEVGYRKDGEGNTIVTKLDEQGLVQIAEAGHGKYQRASNQQNELDAILADIQAMEKKEFGAKVFTEYEDRFQYFLFLGVILLVGEFFISERRNKWIAGLKIFRVNS